MNIENVVDIYFETTGSYGTGCLITSQLILTAKHVLDGSAIGTQCTIKRLTFNEEEYLGTVSWISTHYDAALICISSTTPIRSMRVACVKFGHVPPAPSSFSPLHCEAVGFPEAQKVDTLNADRWLRGTLTRVERGKRFDIDVTNGIPAKANLWGGFSGSAVFLEDLLVGIILRYGPDFDGRVLKALPIITLFNDDSFITELKRGGYQNDVTVETFRIRDPDVDYHWQSVAKSLTQSLFVLSFSTLLLLLIIAPGHSPSLFETAQAATRLYHMSRIDEFVRRNFGRPGEGRVEQPGPLDQIVFNVASDFDDFRSQLPDILADLRAFIKRKPGECNLPQPTQLFTKDNIPLTEDNLTRVASTIFSNLQIVSQRLTSTKIMSKSSFDFSIRDIYTLTTLRYSYDFAFFTIIFNRRSYLDWVCQNFTLQGNAGDDTGLLAFLEHPDNKYINNSDKPLTSGEQIYNERSEMFRQDVFTGDEIMDRVTTLPLSVFYANFEEIRSRNIHVLEQYARTSSPLIGGMFLGMPVNWIVAIFPLIGALTYIYCSMQISLISRRMKANGFTPLVGERNELVNFFGLPRPDRMGRFEHFAEVASYIIISVPICVMLVAGVYNAIWFRNAIVPTLIFGAIRHEYLLSDAAQELIPSFNIGYILLSWVASFVLMIWSWFQLLSRRRALSAQLIDMKRWNVKLG